MSTKYTENPTITDKIVNDAMNPGDASKMDWSDKLFVQKQYEQNLRQGQNLFSSMLREQPPDTDKDAAAFHSKVDYMQGTLMPTNLITQAQQAKVQLEQRMMQENRQNAQSSIADMRGQTKKTTNKPKKDYWGDIGSGVVSGAISGGSSTGSWYGAAAGGVLGGVEGALS